MRLLLFLVVWALPAFPQHSLYACATFTKEYVVGAKLPPSGLFRFDSVRGWTRLGYNHPFLFALDADPQAPGSVFLAAGNGLIRTSENGRQWSILTGSDVTELRDVFVDRSATGVVYFAHTLGIRRTRDGGRTWEELSGARRRRYTEAIRADRVQPRTLVAGTEQGILRSSDDGQTWHNSGASGFQILRLEQSPHDPCFWLATTQGGGLFASHDCAVTFENTPNRVGVGSNLYDISFDPKHPERIAIAGWGPGILISTDGGDQWHESNAGLPAGAAATSVAFDPDHADRIYASVHEDAVFVSEDGARTWRRVGLEGAHVARLKFLPAEAIR